MEHDSINDEQSFDLHKVFEKRHEPQKLEEQSPVKTGVQEAVSEEKSDAKEPKDLHKNAEQETHKNKLKKEDKIEKDHVKADVESDRLKKRLSESQEWGQGAHRKLVAFEKAVKKYLDDDILAEDVAKDLLDHTKHESYEEPVDEDAHSFDPIFKVANPELDNISKYTEDDTLKDKVAAFNYFLLNADPQELQEAHEELTELMNEPVKLAKRMIAIGQTAYDDSYKEILAAGSVKNLKKKYDEKMSLQAKEIDKLKKKIDNYKQKYEDYTEDSNVYLPSGRHDESSDDGAFDLHKVFAQKQKQMQNRR